MYKFILSLILLFASYNSYCQQLPKLDIEINTLRLGSEVGARISSIQPVSNQILPGVGIGLSLSDKNRLLVGFRRLPSRLTSSLGEYSEAISCKGFELSAGYERKIIMNKRFAFLPEIGGFFDYARLMGRANTDYSVVYEINHRRTFYGAYLALKFGYAVTPSVKIILGSRVNGGYMQSWQLHQFNSKETPYGNYKGYAYNAGFVSSLALRILL